MIAYMFVAFWAITSSVPAFSAPAIGAPSPLDDSRYQLIGGDIRLMLDRGMLDTLEWSVIARSVGNEYDDGDTIEFELDVKRSVVREVSMQGAHVLEGIKLRSDGALLIHGNGFRHVISNLTFQQSEAGSWVVGSADPLDHDIPAAFDLGSMVIDPNVRDGSLHILGELSISEALAKVMDDPDSAGIVVGSIVALAELDWTDTSAISGSNADDTSAGGSASSTIGPDVIVGHLYQVEYFASLGGMTAWAIGTISCNAGDEPLSWIPNTNQHPVIAQNMYRYKDSRFEQIGMSWLKHGFAALTGNSCGFGCIEPPNGSHQLGIGCSDPYSAILNGTQLNLGPRSDVNVHTGSFDYPWSAPPPTIDIGRRLQVLEADLIFSQNMGARYFIESQYVASDDAAAGNQNNNAAWREIAVSGFPGMFSAELLGITKAQQPAIRAWQIEDPGVLVANTLVPSDGMFLVGSRATDLGDGTWHYEYAVQNLTSHRSARSFSVPLPGNVAVTAMSFHDVDYHSGEPYDLTDWEPGLGGGLVSWTTEAFNFNQNANALRWGTLYNFGFDADTPPVTSQATIGLFRPGTPPSVNVQAIVPSTPVPVCGDEFIGAGEECDPPDGVHCDSGCQWICGDGVVQETEMCDPPNGVTCDSGCAIIYICGDGTVDPGEECDPPDGVTCAEGCIRIPICGDDIVDTDLGEECDPPNGISCDAMCQQISNDECISAAAICPGAFNGTTMGSTNDGDASCGSTDQSPDAWFRYIPLEDGIVTLDTCGSSLDTVLSVHTDCSAQPSSELGCDDDTCSSGSILSLSVAAGETYLVRVAGWAGSVGPFRLTVDGPACQTGPGISDSCDFLLPVGEGGTVFTTLQNTTDGPTEDTACGVATTIEADGWFCYTPSCTGTASFNTCDSDFDTVVAVYDGCECPSVSSAIACDDDFCPPQSEATIAVTAGQSYLVRVGGKDGATGTGTLSIACFGDGEALRGGLLYDNWWVTNGSDQPAGNHPLYPQVGEQSGSTTFRCKECHGWDYKGSDGAYASGAHFTAIPGVFGSALTSSEMFDLVRSASVANGHGFEELGLTHQDVWDLIEFMQTLLVDTDLYIDGAGAFLGDEVQGQVNYTQNGSISCIVCHGADGTNINFGSTSEPEWVATIATYNPWEFLHKARFGQPGSPMPSWTAAGGSNQGAADIGLYAQLNFPVDCLIEDHCDDGLFCTAPQTCQDSFCIALDEPCPGLLCDESLPGCLSGLCETPTIEAVGSRYLAITPAPGLDPVALRVSGDPSDATQSCLSSYVQEDGSLDVSPVHLMPAEWGTVFVSGFGIRGQATYDARTHCGPAVTPDFSFASSATTWIFADANNNGTVNLIDAQLMVKGFQGNFVNAALEAVDIEPCEPNGVVSLIDALAAVRAFQGIAPDCGDPCS